MRHCAILTLKSVKGKCLHFKLFITARISLWWYLCWILLCCIAIDGDPGDGDQRLLNRRGSEVLQAFDDGHPMPSPLSSVHQVCIFVHQVGICNTVFPLCASLQCHYIDLGQIKSYFHNLKVRSAVKSHNTFFVIYSCQGRWAGGAVYCIMAGWREYWQQTKHLSLQTNVGSQVTICCLPVNA